MVVFLGCQTGRHSLNTSTPTATKQGRLVCSQMDPSSHLHDVYEVKNAEQYTYVMCIAPGCWNAKPGFTAAAVEARLVQTSTHWHSTYLLHGSDCQAQCAFTCVPVALDARRQVQKGAQMTPFWDSN